MKPALNIICLCFFLLVGYKAAFSTMQLRGNGINQTHEISKKAGVSTSKSVFDYNISSDRDNQNDDEFFINDELDEDDLNETIIRNFQRLLHSHIDSEASTLLEDQQHHYKDPKDFNSQLPGIYILQRTLRI